MADKPGLIIQIKTNEDLARHWLRIMATLASNELDYTIWTRRANGLLDTVDFQKLKLRTAVDNGPMLLQNLAN